jgi:hypothetical protein
MTKRWQLSWRPRSFFFARGADDQHLARHLRSLDFAEQRTRTQLTADNGLAICSRLIRSAATPQYSSTPAAQSIRPAATR